MDPRVPAEEVVLDTKWFQIVARRLPAFAEPYYSVRSLDYVTIVALTQGKELLLVRQFRPAVWTTTLELPSGHVEPGQTPEQAARAELLEETGHEATHFELLDTLFSDTGRLGNHIWCFFTDQAVPTRDPAYQPERGIELVRYPGDLHHLMREEGFGNALQCAALYSALLKGKLKL
jgi:ADP-ribose pyrophosphatase